VGGLYRHLFQAGEIEEENAQLEEKVRTLTQQVADLERYRRENEQLREYLEIKEEHSDFSFASASVIGRDTAERFYSFTIDAGSEAGIEKFDPVITSDGLVGLVSEVGKNYAKVLTILDTTIEVGAYDIRTRDIGTTSGDITLARNGQLRLNMLPKDCTVSQGDLIYTTGYGGLYPKDLAIGEVTEIHTDSSGMSMYAVIDPLSDIETVKDVLVITSFEGQGEQVFE
jgi:rod shape-determining protein mreC